MALSGAPRRPPMGSDDARLPPHSIEAEQSVLGSLLIDAQAWDTVGDMVSPHDFYRRDHQLIFEAIASGDGEAARAAMRTHLVSSRERRRRAAALVND